MARIPKYTVVTSKSIWDIDYENEVQHEKECLELWEEQNRIVGDTIKPKVIHWFDRRVCKVSIDTIDDAIQCLAIKEGVDLVRFENGNLGFVAYYGMHEDAFEILPIDIANLPKDKVDDCDLDWLVD